MILVGNQRGGGKDLALHLLKQENEHVEVHEIKGFASQNLIAALNEAYAISRATKCRQYLYSLSLNPPPQENVPISDFEDAIKRIETELGLSRQPRAIVFHEKEGRRHCHVVWSRIDTEKLKAVPLPFTKRKLQNIARELYLEHGWKMPRGLVNSEERDPRNFTLAEWQQAKRAGNDPRAIKTAFQDAWAISDSKIAFIHALEERGYKVARGDRRGYVAVDYQGEVYAIAKWAGIKTKQVRSRMGEENDLLSVAEVKAEIAKDMLKLMQTFGDTLDQDKKERQTYLEKRKKELVTRQRSERRAFIEKIAKRRQQENTIRQQRFRSGVLGLWDRLSGRHRRIRTQNEQEAHQCQLRDRAEKEQMIFKHLGQRQQLQTTCLRDRDDHHEQRQELRQDTKTYQGMLSKLREQRLAEFNRERLCHQNRKDRRHRKRNRGRSLDM